MSRPIKFRVWLKKEKKFHFLSDLYWFEENHVHSFDDSDFIFQQYTGLKDKNGTDIYEGDIIQYNHKEASYDDGATFIVDPIEPLYGTTLTPVSSREKSRKYDFKLSNYMTAGKIYVSVVGNMFENLESLK